MAAYGSLPFQEQIDFLRNKLDLPTERWDDIWQAAHDRAFIVAGASSADLLADLRAAVLKIAEQGATLATFRQDFEAIVAKHGWTGWTGEGTAAGRAWRTRVIYETNLRTSYAAGRYAQLQAVKATRPYWRYRHNDTVLHPREEHLAWDGLVLSADDPWWDTHATPNGWGCRCSIESLAERDLKRLGKSGPDQAPPSPIDPKTGAPVGVDKGWGYAPGANAATPLRELVEQKLFKLDAPIGAAMWEALKDTIAAEEIRRAVAEMVDRVAAHKEKKGESLLVSAVSAATLADLSLSHQVVLESAGIWLRDGELLHALRDTKDALGHTLPVAVWRDLPRRLEQATPYLDTEDQALVYVFDLPDGTGKVVVRINYSDKVRQDGKRSRITANFIRTGGVVAESDIKDTGRYKPLAK